MQPKIKLLLLALFGFLYSFSQITITVRKSFIDSFKNKLTIDANYEIYFAHKHPNSAKNDADLHFSGFDKKIGLPVVAEMMNAKEHQNAIDLIHEKEGKGKPPAADRVKITGVWRLWCEHPGEIEAFKQGKFVIPIENTNPPHVFEIHPITKIESIDVSASFHKIDGYKYKDAEDAFGRYSNLRSKITKTPKTVTIETNGIGYNYVDFWLQLNENTKQEVDDGLFAYCTIYKSDLDTADSDQDDLLTHKLRIGFVKGTAVHDKVKAMNKGDYLHVVGIPRIDLALIAWRVAHAASRPEVLQWNLPFEIVAVGELD